MLKTIQRVPAYNPDFVEASLRGDLGVTNEAIIADILTRYQKWYDGRHFICAVADHTDQDEAHIALVMDALRGWKAIVAVSKNIPRIGAHLQNTLRWGFPELTPLELATMSMGYSNRPWRYGGAQDRKDFTHETWPETASIVRRSVIRGGAKDFMQDVTLHGLGAQAFHNYKEFGLTVALRPLEEHVRLVVRQRVNAAFKEFASHLNQDVLKIMRKVHSGNLNTYTWLTGRPTQDTATAPEDLQKKRRALALRLPALLAHMEGGRNSEELVFDRALMSSQTPVQMLNEAFNQYHSKTTFTPDMIDWLKGKSRFFRDYRMPGKNFDVRPLQMAGLFEMLPSLNEVHRDWRPNTPRELYIFSKALNYIGKYNGVIPKETSQLLKDFMTATRDPGSLPASFFGTSPRSKNMYENLDVIITKLREQHLGDFLAKASTQIILPEIFRQAAVWDVRDYARYDVTTQNKIDIWLESFFPKLFAGMSVVKVASLNMRYHEQSNNLRRRTDTFSDPVSWPALFPAMTLGNGVRARCLTTNVALRDEGYDMAHCVGTYVYQCAFEKSHIVSLTAKDGAWRTTIELMEVQDEETGKRSLKVQQHRGHKNDGNLPPDAQDAEAAMTAYLDRATIDWAAIDGMREAHRADPLLETLLRVGFDHTDRDACDAAYAAWKGTFPTMFPDNTRLGFLKRTGIRAAIVSRLSKYTVGT